MVKKGFSAEMEELLKGLIGSKLLSFNYWNSGPLRRQAYGNMRIYTDKACIEFTNFLEDGQFLYDEIDDVAAFKCKEVEPDSEFRPGVVTKYSECEVGKTITGIEIISEYNRNVKNGFENLFDYGVVIRLGDDCLMLVTGCWFIEVISIYEHDDFEKACPLDLQIDSLCREDEGSVEVKRYIRKL